MTNLYCIYSCSFDQRRYVYADTPGEALAIAINFGFEPESIVVRYVKSVCLNSKAEAFR